MISNVTLTNKDRVCVIHMTCNAFDPACLLQTMKQSYKNIDYIICDDSSKEEYLTQISEFCKKYNVKLFRRTAEEKKKVPKRAGN
jgi:cellulose synthase/poly-beta-1,6-N-acetylglucosamine synthase-like glycosyltransferase